MKHITIEETIKTLCDDDCDKLHLPKKYKSMKKPCKHKWKIMIQKMTRSDLLGLTTYEASIAICEKCLEKRII